MRSMNWLNVESSMFGVRCFRSKENAEHPTSNAQRRSRNK
jgi:hypothetical protein